MPSSINMARAAPVSAAALRIIFRVIGAKILFLELFLEEKYTRRRGYFHLIMEVKCGLPP